MYVPLSVTHVSFLCVSVKYFFKPHPFLHTIDKCGHGGQVAVFTIVRYINYEKPGQYGDEKQAVFHYKLGKVTLIILIA